jgi:hypothetical protein
VVGLDIRKAYSNRTTCAYYPCAARNPDFVFFTGMSAFPIRLLVLFFTWTVYHMLLWGGIDTPTILQSYLDDVLVVPMLMGVALWVQHNWVSQAVVFSNKTIAGVWIYFTVVFEYLFPALNKSYTSDWTDGIAYLTGALLFKGAFNKPLKR